MLRKATRNAQGGGTIRRRSDGTWEGRYTLGRDLGTGKQIQKSVYGKTQAEVRKKLLEITVSIDNSTYVETSKMTVGQWFDIWLSDYMGDKKYLTIKHYHAQYNTHIKPALGAVKLAELKPHDIQKFYNMLLAEGRTVRVKDDRKKTKIEHKPLAAKSVRNIHGILTKCLSVAFRLGYIKSNPASVVAVPRVEKSEIEPLTDTQVKAFLKTVDDDEYGMLLKVILFTGLRESEAMGLTWDCVDFRSGSLAINKQLQKRPEEDGGFQFASLKNDKTRIISPATFVMELLNDRRKQQIEARLRAGEAWQGWSSPKEQEKALVFTSDLGAHLHPQTIYNHFKKIAKVIGASEACVHDLRHTFAVLSLQNGDDVKTVQGNLGHASAAFTLDVYGHVSEKMKKDSADRMQRYILEVSK